MAVLVAGTSSLTAARALVGTVAGKVVAADGGAIAGATISVSGTQFGAIAGNDGTYRINLRPGRYELRARFIGYGLVRDSVVIVAGQTASKNFTLSKAATALQAVAVIGSRVRKSAR